MTSRSRPRHRLAKCRANGAALVELAVCLPVILLTIVAVISLTNLVYLKQTLKIACYEGCRVGIVPQAEEDNVRQQVLEILDARGVKNYTISVSPSNLTTLTPGSYVRVEVEVETAPNITLSQSFAPAKITEAVSMMCEK